MAKVDCSVQGQVAILTLNNPPLNPMSYGLRAGLAERIRRASAHDVIKATIIIDNEQAFCSDAESRLLYWCGWWKKAKTLFKRGGL